MVKGMKSEPFVDASKIHHLIKFGSNAFERKENEIGPNQSPLSPQQQRRTISSIHSKKKKKKNDAWLNGVHRTCSETAAFHVAPAMQQPKSATNTPLPWILIRDIKGYTTVTRSESHATCAQ